MKRAFSLVLVLGLAIVLIGSSAQAILIEFVPSSQDAGLGEQVVVGLVISGLGDFAAPSVGTFDLDVTFNPAVLSFNGVVYGDPALGDQLDLSGMGSLTATTPGIGSVNLFELSFDLADDLNTLQAEKFTLATLSFATMSPGTSFLGLSVTSLGDAIGDPLLADVGSGSVTVTGVAAVAEPSTMLLLGSGLVVLGGIVWRRSCRK